MIEERIYRDGIERSQGFYIDDHELVNDIWGAGSTGRRNRRAVFRDIGTRAWLDYLGWANPAAFPHPVHHGQATLTADSDVLVDPEADFTVASS